MFNLQQLIGENEEVRETIDSYRTPMPPDPKIMALFVSSLGLGSIEPENKNMGPLSDIGKGIAVAMKRDGLDIETGDRAMLRYLLVMAAINRSLGVHSDVPNPYMASRLVKCAGLIGSDNKELFRAYRDSNKITAVFLENHKENSLRQEMDVNEIADQAEIHEQDGLMSLTADREARENSTALEIGDNDRSLEEENDKDANVSIQKEGVDATAMKEQAARSLAEANRAEQVLAPAAHLPRGNDANMRSVNLSGTDESVMASVASSKRAISDMRAGANATLTHANAAERSSGYRFACAEAILNVESDSPASFQFSPGGDGVYQGTVRSLSGEPDDRWAVLQVSANQGVIFKLSDISQGESLLSGKECQIVSRGDAIDSITELKSVVAEIRESDRGNDDYSEGR